MLRLRIVACLMIAVLLLQCGGGVWVALYTVSKTYQTYRTAKVAGVLAAIERLPKGKGNCGVCTRVAKAKARDDAQQRQTKANIKEMISFAFFAPQDVWHGSAEFSCEEEFSAWVPRGDIRGERPPFPPPRWG